MIPATIEGTQIATTDEKHHQGRPKQKRQQETNNLSSFVAEVASAINNFGRGRGKPSIGCKFSVQNNAENCS